MNVMLCAKRVKRAIAGLARGGLHADTCIARHLDAPHRELDAAFQRKRITMREPRIGFRAQAVMHMKRHATRRARNTHGCIEQHARIDAAAERDRNSGVRRQSGKRGADRLENEAISGRFGWRSHVVRRSINASCADGQRENARA